MPPRGHDPSPPALRHDPPARVVSRRYHFHWPGLAYAACAVVLVFGAINGQNNLLFWFFGLAVAGLIISGLISGAVLMRLELRREAPRAGVVGEPLTVVYTVRNRARLMPAMALHIEELADRGPARRVPPLRAVSGVAPFVPAMGELAVRTTVRPTRRGRAEFSRVRVWTTFPFGLMKKSVTFEQHAEVLIRPSPAVIDPGVWRFARGVAGGEAPAHSRNGDEFHSLREYAPGDSVRRIAWRATARLDRPVIRELSSRSTSDAVIVLDPRNPDGWEHAVSAAAGLAIDAVRRGCAVGLSAAGVFEPPSRGGRQLDRLLDALALTEPSPAGAPPIDSAAQRLRIRAVPGGAVVECGPRTFAVTAPQEVQA